MKGTHHVNTAEGRLLKRPRVVPQPRTNRLGKELIARHTAASGRRPYCEAAMTRLRITPWLMNVFTAGMVAWAVLTGGMRTWTWIHPVDAASSPITRHVSDWRKYTTAGHRIGLQSAQVTIVEFADFQCPFCQAAAPVIDRLIQEYPSQVALVYRHYVVHKLAFPAAVAAECADDDGQFSAFHRLVFAKQDSIGKVSWTGFAQQAGIADTIKFVACMAGPIARANVIRDTLAAHSLGVTGTPTFLVNDLEVLGFPGADSLTRYVERALRSAAR
jgi:protein-disulfide isomerase